MPFMPPLRRTLIDIQSHQYPNKRPMPGVRRAKSSMPEARDVIITTVKVSDDEMEAQVAEGEAHQSWEPCTEENTVQASAQSMTIPDTDPTVWQDIMDCATETKKSYPAGDACDDDACSEATTVPYWRSENDEALATLQRTGIRVKDYGWASGHPPERVGEDELAF
ncbi:hypothetical protein D9757_006394 [Collybiopsis confluens]|uniref:Uncharacterized protein n=1 Tax=Collybiopsis confluens TaxID=2823264 RepID=A0A8H5HGI6_9AGAR|nr:hypothetical protein D9757_006394 [Collybiopsis confluens]